MITVNGGFRGQYPGFEVQQREGSSIPTESQETRVNENANAEQSPKGITVPESRGFLGITGKAIADLAAKNPLGAILTIILLGIGIYKVQNFVQSRRRVALRRLR